MKSAKPRAAINGPATSGIFGPYFSTSPPAQRESRKIIKMNGKRAAPAAVAE
jgi:hypothetical protein